jgi:hypothetical protein
MNPSLSAYTNLESLLLFQCLHAYGVAPAVFGRISDLLKKHPDITAHKYFQPGRLSPDALRNFYLERLKRESTSRAPTAMATRMGKSPARARERGIAQACQPSRSRCNTNT